jgi:uncharacterized protein (DUF362 family)/ferredoxin
VFIIDGYLSHKTISLYSYIIVNWWYTSYRTIEREVFSDRFSPAARDLKGFAMTDAKASIVRAFEYEHDCVYKALERAMELIGGIDDIIRPGSKVFVKINHLPPPSTPERGIITHPVFVEAVVNFLKKAGADVTVGDDIESGEVDGFDISGFREMCKRADVKLVNLRERGFAEIPCNGMVLEKAYISTVALEADVIVNLPKLKTHSLTLFTGSIKNMYGTVPGGLRSRYHGMYRDRETFSRMLTDIFSVAIPQLTIMDGIVAMEGEGPAAGSLRNLGIMLASRDGVALDAVAAGIIGLGPMEVYTTRFAHERGLGTGDFNEIEILGEDYESLKITDFQFPATISHVLMGKIPASLLRYILSRMTARPDVKRKNCTGCKKCEEICPVGAAMVINNVAEIDRDLCIQCMCCHEVCRFNAIVLRRSVTGNLIHFLRDVIRFIRR